MTKAHEILHRGTFKEHKMEMQTKIGCEKSWEFKARPTDILITTYGKTGTTMLQNLCHQLRTRGDDTFDDIYFAAPWIEIAYDYGIDITSSEPQFRHEFWNDLSPRIFKTHRRLSNASPGGKYIVTFRNPVSTLVSFYTFLSVEMIEDGLSLDDFILGIENYRGGSNGAPWGAFEEFWKARNCEDVLLLCFEDIIENPIENIKTIAKFMELDHNDEELISIAKKNSSKEWMLAHIDKFDEKKGFQRLKEISNIELRAKNLVTTSEHHKKITPKKETIEWIFSKWSQTFPQWNNYEDFVKDFKVLKKDNSKYFQGN